jgi:hypothetical protein
MQNVPRASRSWGSLLLCVAITVIC